MQSVYESRVIQETLSRLEELDAIYERASIQLIPTVPDHPVREMRIFGIPRKLRELCFLKESMTMLECWGLKVPAWLVLELEEAKTRLTKNWRLREEYSFIVSQVWNNDRFRNGRVLPLALSILKEIRVYSVLPRKPRRKTRTRGYRDHGSMLGEAERGRRQADILGQLDLKVLDSFYEARSKDYERADQILELERRGHSAEEIQAMDAGDIPETELVEDVYHPSALCERIEALGVKVQDGQLPSEAVRQQRRVLEIDPPPRKRVNRNGPVIVVQEARKPGPDNEGPVRFMKID